MANINTGSWKDKDLPVSTKVSGDYYDTCPNCGSHDVEPFHITGSEDHHLHSLYCHDRKKGGCGYNWTRTDARAAVRDRKRGINPKWLTSGGITNRVVSVPSEAYRENFARIFGHE
jgi:hypothetical protein